MYNENQNENQNEFENENENENENQEGGKSRKSKGVFGDFSKMSVRSMKKAMRGLKSQLKTAKVSKGGKRKSTAWTKLVAKTYKMHHKKNKNYSLGDAMKDARKVYKKGGNSNENFEEGNEGEENQQDNSEELAAAFQSLGGKKSKKGKK